MADFVADLGAAALAGPGFVPASAFCFLKGGIAVAKRAMPFTISLAGTGVNTEPTLTIGAFCFVNDCFFMRPVLVNPISHDFFLDQSL